MGDVPGIPRQAEHQMTGELDDIMLTLVDAYEQGFMRLKPGYKSELAPGLDMAVVMWSQVHTALCPYQMILHCLVVFEGEVEEDLNDWWLTTEGWMQLQDTLPLFVSSI